MENAVKTQLQSVQFGELQQYKNIAILPLISTDGRFQYRTLGETIATGEIVITEVSAAGSVPELMVVNRGNTSVLLIDGEELAGARQNRVLNTSILLKEASQTKIPVSCTEQGRWSYASPAFSESGNVMAYKSRSKKTRSVQCSLEESGAYASDQGQVWAELSKLQSQACAPSPTSAMSDVYKARADDLQKCDEIFKSLPNQVGLLAFIDGNPAGMDLVSLNSAYAKLHLKLVRSYALEGLIVTRQNNAAANSFSEKAANFLAQIATAQETCFPSIGYGEDHRYRAKALAGTALVYENEVIHAAFFRLDETEQADRIASLRNRRGHYHL